MKTPDYITTEDVAYGPISVWSSSGEKVLEKGSFVRPIETRYVPKDTMKSDKCARFHPDTHVFCYTFHGIIPVPFNAIRRI